MITPATAAFALLVDRSARAASISMPPAALGTPQTRRVDDAMCAAITLCSAIVVMIGGLGQPRWPAARERTASGKEMHRRLLKACIAHAATAGLAAADTRRVRAFP